ncbi:hypothetical protein FJQ98_20625 [Lysinibacillus agricola]|uniref:Uncharacterized protein n=1 Tax=Lysinibacillus agricola TaxID=2590012 RepID=A0ABX7AP25_9BACI|nr:MULTISPECIES: hypothetical protein [Lysinibacillus]KOS60876.1 hypothetical protein AN161_20040 [Lysinibacillus sp. FJAT-14222]QQP11575.1 hypothetical protein FJQ98_20625 [Lysinibacillus agricola]
MPREPVKEYLLKKYPLNVNNIEEAYNSNLFWENCDFEKAQEISNKIIELLKAEDMTYTDAYAMLGYIRLDLEYRANRLRL